MPTGSQSQSSSSQTAIVLTYCDSPLPATAGDTLLDVILASGREHRHICGGRGFCTSCRVQVLLGEEALSPVSPIECERLGSLAGVQRLACQARIFGAARVSVPPPVSSRFSPDGE